MYTSKCVGQRQAFLKMNIHEKEVIIIDYLIQKLMQMETISSNEAFLHKMAKLFTAVEKNSKYIEESSVELIRKLKECFEVDLIYELRENILKILIMNFTP